MHTTKYYKYVNAKMEACVVNGEAKREDVEAALLEIRADIEYAEATGIRKWDLE